MSRPRTARARRDPMPGVPRGEALDAEVEKSLFTLAAESRRRRQLAGSDPEVVRDAAPARWRDDLCDRVAEAIDLGADMAPLNPIFAVHVGIGLGFSPDPQEVSGARHE
ncbi:MAG: hypothetical protein ACRD0J_13490 [Acidimicrobiales bacterium]